MKARVLLVDDEKSVTQLVRVALEETSKFEVRELNRGGLAVGAAQVFQPNLILLDWHFSDANGLDIARSLRTNRFLKNTPIVFLSGALTAEQIRSDDDLRGIPTLQKPFQSRALVDWVAQFLGVDLWTADIGPTCR